MSRVARGSRWPHVALAALLVAVAGCAGGDPPRVALVCNPRVECVCAGGAIGILVCDQSGSVLGCACDGDAGSPDGGAARDALAALLDGPVTDLLSAADGATPADDAPAADAGAYVPGDDARADSATASTDRAAPADADGDAPTDLAAPPDATDAPAPDTRGCVPEPSEWCDGRDNDCDGRVDEGHVCPEPEVRNTLPFTNGVYFVGTTQEALCGKDAVQRFWPTRSTTYYTGIGCDSDSFSFRPSDWSLFYQGTFSGIHQLALDQKRDTLVPTPPCGDGVGRRFGFDAADQLHYLCYRSLRRNNGEELGDVQSFVATLADGRVVVTRESPYPRRPHYEVLAPSGATLSSPPADDFVGEMIPLSSAATVHGNDAFVLFQRKFLQEPDELVVFRLTPANHWLLVRRVRSPRIGKAQLAISDGTLFLREADPTTKGEDRIVALTAAGTETVIWREAEVTVVRSHANNQLLVGPAEPFGVWVVSE